MAAAAGKWLEFMAVECTLDPHNVGDMATPTGVFSKKPTKKTVFQQDDKSRLWYKAIIRCASWNDTWTYHRVDAKVPNCEHSSNWQSGDKSIKMFRGCVQQRLTIAPPPAKPQNQPTMSCCRVCVRVVWWKDERCEAQKVNKSSRCHVSVIPWRFQLFDGWCVWVSLCVFVWWR